jgi:hypothetical protein
MAVARIRVIRRNRGMEGANPDGLLYSTASFLGGGVCGLQRCRSAICEYIGEGK